MEHKAETNGAGISGYELIKNREAIAALARSSSARKLMELLQAQNTDVHQAAQAAASGDPSGLMSMMNRLIGSKEGADLVDRIEAEAKKAGLQ